MKETRTLRLCDLVLLSYSWCRGYRVRLLGKQKWSHPLRIFCFAATRQRKASACILYALSWFQKQRRLRQTSNKSYRIQNLLNWDYWEVNFRCNILRHRFLGKVLADMIIKIKLREFLTGNVWTQIKHGGQRPVYTLLITMVKWVAKRTIESRLPGARKREMNGMFSWCYRRWMLSFPGSFPCVTRSRKRI